jgi:hypothetical protein
MTQGINDEDLNNIDELMEAMVDIDDEEEVDEDELMDKEIGKILDA